MTRKLFRSIIIICVAAFIMVALSIALCANYLLSYKPPHTENDIQTYIVTDENGETQVIQSQQIEGSYNILILGHDRAALLTDVIMLVNYNDFENKVTITQFPRDTYVSGDFPANKMNAMFRTYYVQEINDGKDYEEARLAATRHLADTLETTLGINIYKTAIMDLDGFVQIVDAIGGVEVNVPSDMHYEDPAQKLYIDLSAGTQVLNGSQAEQFVRFRAKFVQADIGRQNSQKIFLSSLVKKMKDTVSITNTGTLTNIANAFLSNMTTDLTVSDFVYFGKGLIGDVDMSNIRMFTAPGNAVTNEGGWSCYLLQKNVMMQIIVDHYNTTDISDDILMQNFDKSYLFSDVNSQILMSWYNSTDEPMIGYDFNAQDIIDHSIDIPRID